MNGLKYVLFMKEMTGKELANQLHVSQQLVASWCNGSRTIADHYLEPLGDILRVEPQLLKKELLLEDKMTLDLQLGLGGIQSEQLLEVAEVYKRHETLKQRYLNILNQLYTLEAKNRSLEHVIQQMRELLKIE